MKYAIVNTAEGTTDAGLFWSNDLGWVDRDSATAWTEEEMRGCHLPVDGVWCVIPEPTGNLVVDARRAREEGERIARSMGARGRVRDRYGWFLSALTQLERIEELHQLAVDMMDHTEQTDDERFFIELAKWLVTRRDALRGELAARGGH